MSLRVKIDSAVASPSSMASGDTTSISIAAFGKDSATRAMSEYVIKDADPVVFANGQKRMRSDLVFVSTVGTSITSRLMLKLTSATTGQVTVTILTSERDSSGIRLGSDFQAGVVIEIH